MNEEVITSQLIKKLKDAESCDIFNLIVQFEDEVSDKDLKVLNALNFEIVEVFHVIPAVHVFGKKNAVISLSNYDRTYWIETNDKLTYNLDVSTAAINATKTWNRIVTDFGNVHDSIDGSGVTVVVADTGIDATHPDLDYEEKVILNLKKDIDHPGTWKEMQNTDTFFGHGTHCAGIIGGTGEASAGARRGVAPGVSLIGLSIGDPWETNEVGGLQWVYDNSRPNANPYNIRAVSNSWGYEEEIDANFKDAVMQLTMKLTYENNVLVVFAAGNDGEEDHDGHESTTSIYANVPAALCVAASQRDGIGLADFSSRGDKTKNETWPDITAPGVNIWSARDSLGKMGKTNIENPYYIPASGTSMATPHIAGVVALLFQAAPSLTISDFHDDASIDDEGFWDNPETRIHEVEYILKTTSDFMTEGDGIPGDFEIGLEKKPHDFAQGYGLVNVERAVGLTLTLEKLRSEREDVTVQDALRAYMGVINDTTASSKTDILVASWKGEYTLHNEQNFKPLYTTDQAHYIFISNESKKLVLDLSFPPINLDDNTLGSITITVDYNDDGEVDWSGSLLDQSALNGQRHDEIDISSGDYASYRGNFWAFSIYGYAISTPFNPGWPAPGGFKAPTIEYSTSIQQVIDFSSNDEVFVDYMDFRSSIAQLKFGKPSNEYEEGMIKLNIYEYNLSRALYIDYFKPVYPEQDTWLIAVIMDVILAFIVIAVLIRRLLKEGKTDARMVAK